MITFQKSFLFALFPLPLCEAQRLLASFKGSYRVFQKLFLNSPTGLQLPLEGGRGCIRARAGDAKPGKAAAHLSICVDQAWGKDRLGWAAAPSGMHESLDRAWAIHSLGFNTQQQELRLWADHAGWTGPLSSMPKNQGWELAWEGCSGDFIAGL